MTGNGIFLSILIPTWKRVDSVVEAVLSVDIRHLDDVEIIIVDNASEMEIYNALEEKLGKIQAVKLYRNDSNIGMVGNWNRTMALASGEWLGLLCSDDQYIKGRLEYCYELMKRTTVPALIIQDPSISEDVQYFEAGEKTIKTMRYPQPSGNFWHKELVGTLGPFDEQFEYSPDAEYWPRMITKFPLIKLKNKNARYHQHEENYMWSTWREEDFLEQMMSIEMRVLGYLYPKLSEEERMRLFDHSQSATLETMLLTSVGRFGKGDIVRKYFPIYWERIKGNRAKLFFVWKLIKMSLRNPLWQFVRKCGYEDKFK